MTKRGQTALNIGIILMVRRVIRLIPYVITGSTDELLVTPMDRAKVRFGWIMSTAVDPKAHLRTALITVGV